MVIPDLGTVVKCSADDMHLCLRISDHIELIELPPERQEAKTAQLPFMRTWKSWAARSSGSLGSRGSKVKEQDLTPDPPGKTLPAEKLLLLSNHGN